MPSALDRYPSPMAMVRSSIQTTSPPSNVPGASICPKIGTPIESKYFAMAEDSGSRATLPMVHNTIPPLVMTQGSWV